MRFLILTDIEGVTGVTTFEQAEQSEFGKRMLMNDVNAVIDGIQTQGNHEIILWDMHTDGRNIDLQDLGDRKVEIIEGKPINRNEYKSVNEKVDGLFMVGLHSMAGSGGLLAHSYLREYASIRIGNTKVGEIGVESYLAGEQGIPVLFVSGDTLGCREAQQLIPGVKTVTVKRSLGDDQAVCYTPVYTRGILKKAAYDAVNEAASGMKYPSVLNYNREEIHLAFSKCRYLAVMHKIHPDIFENEDTVMITGDTMLEAWETYRTMEQEMVRYE